MSQQWFGGSLWREGILQAVCIGGIVDVVFWWLPVARRRLTGRASWWVLSRSVLVARFNEKVVYEPCVLVVP